MLLPAPGAPDTSVRRLAKLPYDIQEDITGHLSISDLQNLSLASKYLCTLAARALYTTIYLHSAYSYPCSDIDSDSNKKHRPPKRLNLRPLDALRLRQFSFFVAIARHPEYTRFIRHVSFEFTNNQRGFQHTSDYLVPVDLVWKAFARCKGVLSIHISMANDGERRVAPVQEMFPNLVHATVDGAFPEYTLDRMLLTSRRLRSLEIGSGTAEMVSDETSRRQNRAVGIVQVQDNLAHFVGRSVAQGAFGRLRLLKVACEKSGDVGLGESLPTLLEAVREELEELGLNVIGQGRDEERWWNEWGSMLKKVEWKALERIRVGGKAVTREMVDEMSPRVIEESR